MNLTGHDPVMAGDDRARPTGVGWGRSGRWSLQDDGWIPPSFLGPKSLSKMRR